MKPQQKWHVLEPRPSVSPFVTIFSYHFSPYYHPKSDNTGAQFFSSLLQMLNELGT